MGLAVYGGISMVWVAAALCYGLAAASLVMYRKKIWG
jgi:hypothetical protein